MSRELLFPVVVMTRSCDRRVVSPAPMNLPSVKLSRNIRLAYIFQRPPLSNLPERSLTEHATLCKPCGLTWPDAWRLPDRKRENKGWLSAASSLDPSEHCGRAPLLLLEKYNNSDKTVITTVIYLGQRRPVSGQALRYLSILAPLHACACVCVCVRRCFAVVLSHRRALCADHTHVLQPLT